MRLRYTFKKVIYDVAPQSHPQMTSSSELLPDILNRDDIDLLVNDFYAKVRNDEMLGTIFNDIAEVDWETHIPKIGNFWETALFRSGNYRGNPLGPHLRLSMETPMGRQKFQRWLDLFFASVDSHFSGQNAGHIKRIAADMAEVMQRRISTQKTELE